MKYSTVILAISILALNWANNVFACDHEPCDLCINYLEWGYQGGNNLPDQGAIPDLVKTVWRKAGYRPKVHIVPWDRGVQDVLDGKCDMMAGVWEGKNFDDTFEYLSLIHIERTAFVVLKDSKFKD